MHPVRTLFRTFTPPRPNVVVDLVYFEPTEDNPEFWTIRCYRDNFDKLSGEDRVVVFNYISDIIRTIRSIEPNVWPEIHERLPGGSSAH